MSCLADEVVAAWLDGALADHERASAIDHATGCAECRELVGAVFDGQRGAPVTIGRYEIVGTIGSGGMGVVLRGRDPVLNRSVAIKLARAGIDDEMLREAQALARLNHPNVVAVYDFGESGGEVFVAMAVAEGVPLSRWLDEPHTLAEKLRVLDGVAAGLAAIHDADLVHRDIKPDNIVVRATGEASIVDFGLARPSAPSVVGSGLAGTRDYIAPEVLAGAPASPASDQYAWWVLVGEVLRDISGSARARIDAARTRGMSSDRFPSMHAAASALRRACAPRWRLPVAIAAMVALASITVLAATRDRDDPCAWSATFDRGALATGLRAAGVDVDRVLAAIDRRVTTTRQLHREACMLARRDDADDRAMGQYRLACLDRTWAEAASHFGPLSSPDRDEVWSALDQLGLVLDPKNCAKASRAMLAPASVDPSTEVTRVGRAMMAIARDDKLDTTTRLAKLDAMEMQIMAVKHAPLAARWHGLRAGELVRLGMFDKSAEALERAELAAETSGDDDLRAEIAINRLALAYASGNHDTAALEARALALVDKLDNPVRRAELADTRGILQTARGDVPGAIASMREAVAFYETLSLDASERESRALQNLAATLQMAGDLDGAQQTFDRGLARTIRRYGADSADAYEMRGARASNLLAAGRVEEARKELALVLDGLAKRRGVGDYSLGMAHMMLCQAETEAKAPTAIDRCRAALEHAEAVHGPEHAQLVGYLIIYGNALRTSARPKDAIEVLTRAIEIAETGGTIQHTELAQARAYFALALHAVDAKDPRGPAAARAAKTALANRPDMARIVEELDAVFE